ncbi:MAG: phosphotransferase [Chloroflexi bacterium]|nr:phosphotransferase [Chloroflexota bacterium]
MSASRPAREENHWDRGTSGFGLADLHIHSLASDGTSGVLEILQQAEDRTKLDLIAITDHERIDAAVAAQRMARAHGFRVQVIVGEEITTRGGHLLGLFLERRIRPFQSLRSSVRQVHEQGGLAIIAHPLVPYPLCASARSIRRLLDDPDPVHHPDGIEAFNPTTAGMRWQRRVPPFVAEVGLAPLGNSDAHRAEDLGQGYTAFPGHTPEELRAAILAHSTEWHGAFYPWRSQFSMFGRQVRKNAVAVRDEVRGKLLRDGTGRDLGYPGGRRRPAGFDESEVPR